MRFSQGGERFARATGILELMEDLDRALNQPGDLLMLGGGNPGRVPEVEEVLERTFAALAGEPERVLDLLGVYDHPQGDGAFRAGIAEYLGQVLARNLGPQNIALTNGSQSAFAGLFALFGGVDRHGLERPLVLPVLPEYVGYADIPGALALRGVMGRIEATGPHRFRYRVDFAALEQLAGAGAFIVSRPTNPSANMLSPAELGRLAEVAADHDAPLILDCAYGAPFPGLSYLAQADLLPASAVLVFSLSKLGLPGVRTGIVVGPEEVVSALGRYTAVSSLSVGSLGPALGMALLESGELRRLGSEVLPRYYRAKRDRAVAILDEQLGGALPWQLHEPDGAFFLWLRLPGLPVSDRELYERLKGTGVVTVPGGFFYPGLSAGQAPDPALRISYARDQVEVERGLGIIADVVKRCYERKS